MEHEHCVVYVTCPNHDSGEAVASALVDQKLVACVNVIDGVTSLFHWEGRVDRDPEVLLVIKTRTNLLQAVEECVAEVHPYDVPEVIALPIIGGSRKYLDWIDESVENRT
ncbi:MAG: divalent-cation tolerance protein CutA [Gammaproteobacteria bacterium]|nr:divalent-cation tolerance protein CutA [Gammaproteobacteria bacterium]